MLYNQKTRGNYAMVLFEFIGEVRYSNEKQKKY